MSAGSEMVCDVRFTYGELMVIEEALGYLLICEDRSPGMCHDRGDTESALGRIVSAIRENHSRLPVVRGRFLTGEELIRLGRGE